jgi:hypothetical protein
MNNITPTALLKLITKQMFIDKPYQLQGSF